MVSLNLCKVNGFTDNRVEWDIVPQINAPSPRHSATAVLHKNSMYVFGGATESGATNELLSFNFLTKKWEVVVPHGAVDSPPPRCGHCSVIWKDSVVIHGGFCDQDSSTTEDCCQHLWRFSLRSHKWSCLRVCGTTIPAPPHFHSAVLVNNRLYVLEGKGAKTVEKHISPQYCIDLKSLTLEHLPIPPQPWADIFGHTCTALAGTSLLLFLGGFSGAENHAVSNVALFDISNYQWTNISSEGNVAALHFHGIACSPGKIFVLGGIPQNSERAGDMFWCCSRTGCDLDVLSSLPEHLLCCILQVLPLTDILFRLSHVNKALYKFCHQQSTIRSMARCHGISFPTCLLDQLDQFNRFQQQIYEFLAVCSYPDRMWLPRKDFTLVPLKRTCWDMKICVVGAPQVGKSNLILRFRQGIFVEQLDPSYEGDDDWRKMFQVDTAFFSVDIVEEGKGLSQNPKMLELSIQHAHVLFVCFSLAEPETLEYARNKFQQIRTVRGTAPCPIFLVGCKSDLSDNNRSTVSFDAFSFAHTNRIPYLETSAKLNTNVDACFHQAGKEFFLATQPEPPPSKCLLM
ncbi:CBN-RAP-3 protein [Pelomyxa schiedti]|nr:CBN-RAP-3 protein [Pelomyxa schiedti]